MAKDTRGSMERETRHGGGLSRSAQEPDRRPTPEGPGGTDAAAQPLDVGPGTRLGHYVLEEQIGAGGMGTVFAARDTKLGRRVALKLLPPETTVHSRRRGRFEREARVLASLDHPNIVRVYSVEEGESPSGQPVAFITMELLRGRQLYELIEDGMTMRQFLEIALPITEALAAAHSSGFIHRDLKPTNVMVEPDGSVKVLDFGIAKLDEQFFAQSDDSQTYANLTVQGAIVGTVAYMSPEQAQGSPVDQRTDIFSLGVLFYEMLTSVRPFVGANPSSTISSILRDEPEAPSHLSPGLSPDLDRIVRRCLAKDPSRRYQTAIDVRNELEELLLRPEESATREVQAVGEESSGVRGLGWLLPAAAVAGAAAAALLFRTFAPAPPAPELEGRWRQITHHSGEELYPTLSPNGDTILFASRQDGDWDVFLQRVGGRRAINLTAGSDDDDTQPAFAPDGARIAFRSSRGGGGVFLMGATGESVRRLTSGGFNPSWSPDGREIVFASEGVVTEPLARSPPSELRVVEVATGRERVLLDAGETDATWADGVQPSWSPGGARVAYWGQSLVGQHRDIWTIAAEGGEPVRVTQSSSLDWNPVWSPSGDELWFLSDRGGSVNFWRVAVDEDTGELLGAPQPFTSPSASVAHPRFGREGALVYASILEAQNIRQIFLDAAGRPAGAERAVTRGSVQMTAPHVSPDGEWLVTQSWGIQEDLYVVRADGSERRRLTEDEFKDRRPRWSPDGRRIAFYSNRSGGYEIWVVDADGANLTQFSRSTDGRSANFPIWSPDGRRLAYYQRRADANLLVDSSEPQDPDPEALPAWYTGDKHMAVSDWSPDGRHLAGELRGPAGQYAGGIAVHDLETGAYRKLSDFGHYPVWLGDSQRLLFHTRAGEVYRTSLAGGEPEKLLGRSLSIFSAVMPAADGRSLFLAVQEDESDVWMFEPAALAGGRSATR